MLQKSIGAGVAEFWNRAPVKFVVLRVPAARIRKTLIRRWVGKGLVRHSAGPIGMMEVNMYDWNAVALFGVVGLGMTTSAGLLVHTVVTALRARGRPAERATCHC